MPLEQSSLKYIINYFKVTPRKPLPVMAWIHGGAFKYGDTTENIYGPDYLLEKNVILVSINYGLGALGIYYFYTIR